MAFASRHPPDNRRQSFPALNILGDQGDVLYLTKLFHKHLSLSLFYHAYVRSEQVGSVPLRLRDYSLNHCCHGISMGL